MDHFRHIPIVQKSLVVGQRVERRLVVGQRLTAQILRTHPPIPAILVPDDQVAEGIFSQYFDGRQATPTPCLVNFVNSNHRFTLHERSMLPSSHSNYLDSARGRLSRPDER